MKYRVVEIEGKFYPQWKKNVIDCWSYISQLDAFAAGSGELPNGQFPYQAPSVQPSLEAAIEVCQREEEYKKKPVERVAWKSYYSGLKR
jgi:hypothetical protein